MKNENQSNRVIAKGIKMPNGETFWETEDGKKYTKDDHYFIGDNENYGECRSVTMIEWNDWNRPYEYLAGKYGEGWMFHRSTDSGVTLLGRVCIPAQQSPADDEECGCSGCEEGHPCQWSKQSPAPTPEKSSTVPSPSGTATAGDDGLLPIGPHDHPDCRVMYWSEQELRAIKDYAKRCIAAQGQSPRITEQDAREIYNSAINYIEFYKELSFDDWIKSEEGLALLAKLNGGSDGE